MSLNNKTHYALLGVSMDADAATIDQAYRHLQQEYASLGDGRELQARLQLLGDAHACLSNPLRRRIYDNSLLDRPAAGPVETAPAKALPLKPIGLALLALLLIAAGAAFKSRPPAAAPTATATVAVGQAAGADHVDTPAGTHEQTLREVGLQLMDIDFQISELKRQAGGANYEYNERYRSIDMQYGHLVETGRAMTEHSSNDKPRYSEDQIREAVEARQRVEQLRAKIEEMEQHRIEVDNKREQLVAAKRG